jgi:hypothetical protein
MTDALSTLADYEVFLYTLAQRHASIRHAAITLVRRGAAIARVQGELAFGGGYRVVVRELLMADHLGVHIQAYGYEIWQGEAKLCWYDPQPHPEQPDLQANFPHHKHIPPDIKQHRVPAPELSFHQPNLPAIIREVEAMLARTPAQAPKPATPS